MRFFWAVVLSFVVVPLCGTDEPDGFKGQYFLAGGKDRSIPHQLRVKFNPSYKARLDSRGGIQSLNRFDTGPISALTAKYNLSYCKVLNLSDETIERFEHEALAGALKRTGKRSLPEYGGFAGFFSVSVNSPSPEKLLKLAEELEQLDCVQYVELVPMVQPLPPSSREEDPLAINQRYMRAADYDEGGTSFPGVDYPYAWSVGATGQGVTLRDIEFGWNLGHEEFVGIDMAIADGITYVAGDPLSSKPFYEYTCHGSCVLGVIMAGHNGKGVMGAAPNISKVRLYPEENKIEGEIVWDRINSLAKMINDAQPGDVVLLEIQSFGPVDDGLNGYYVPAEYAISTWELTRMGVDKGAVVITTGGNGGQNLDLPVYESYMNRGSSGSIFVAGSGYGTLSLYTGADAPSNYGSRMDVHAWGCGIATSSGSALGMVGSGDAYYTYSFGGTSGAGAIIAAVAVSTQSYALQKLGRYLNTREMRDLMVNYSTPQNGTEHIGPQPDLKKMLQRIDYLKDNPPQLLMPNPVNEVVVDFDDTVQVDLASMFTYSGSGTISYTNLGSSDPEVVSASLSGSMMSLTGKTGPNDGLATVTIRAQVGSETIQHGILVRVRDTSIVEIHYDQGASSGFGYLGDCQYVGLIRLTSDELSTYYGDGKIKGIKFWLTDMDTSTWSKLEARVYSGDSNGPNQLLYKSADLGSGIEMDTWTIHVIPEAQRVPLVSGKDYFVGYYIHQTSGRPMGIDNSVSVTGKGNWVSTTEDGGSLDNFFLTQTWGSSFNFNWAIRAQVQVPQTVEFIGDDLVGSWQGLGVWGRFTQKKSWQKYSDNEAKQLVTGDINGDGLEDVVGWWSGIGIWVRYSHDGSWERILDGNNLIWLGSGDLNGDGLDDIVGSWTGLGVYCRDSASGGWTKIHSDPASQITLGDMNNDGKDDLVGVWSYGIWVRYSASQWSKILNSTGVIHLTTGDMNGDGKEDLVGSWTHGTWCLDTQSGAWTRLHDSALMVSAGDMDGDQKADLLGTWAGLPGIYVRYSGDGSWVRFHDVSPQCFSTGNLD